MTCKARAELARPEHSKIAVAVAAVLLAQSAPVWPADILVNSDATLRAAITGAATGDRIVFQNNITLAADLPTVGTNVTIVGNNNTLSGNNQFRGLLVGGFSGTTQTPVSVSVSNLTITNARAQGGNGAVAGGGGAGLGGALFVANQATLTVSNVTLTGNSAVGGSGGGAGASGGGGGMGGNGGTTVGGGGGLGVGSTGGNNAAPGQAGIATGGGAGGTGGSGAGGGTAGGANGGGGGGAVSAGGGGSAAGGGVGGANGVNGGAGTLNGGAGGFGGGGGAGGGGAATGGAGGFGGGGGANTNGGAGGFGGGGSGSGGGAAGTGGFGGGNGVTGGAGGGGGAGLGGAVFVQQGGTLNVAGGFTVNGGTVTAGAAGGGAATAGSAFGAGIFLQGNGTLGIAPASGVTVTVSDVITDQTGSGGTGGNAGSWTLAVTGPGTLVLSAANSYSGGTSVNAGTLVTNSTLASAITVNNGGTLVANSALAPAITVNSGGVMVANGALTSVVTVNGGTLGGTGSVGGANILAGGVFAPGNSIGTTTVNGNVTFAPGSIYRVEVDAAGNADRINATGTATLNGGTVQVQTSAGTYQNNTVYTILNAAGGVTGTFASASTTLGFFQALLTYDANNVFLTLARVSYSSVAVTPNQVAVARHLETLMNVPAAAGLITQVESLTTDQARTAFSSIGGDSLSAMGTVAMAESRRFMGLISSRIGTPGTGTGLAFSGVKLAAGASSSDAPAVYAQAGAGKDAARPASGRGFWMQATGSRGEMDGNSNAFGFDWNGTSFTAGVDTELSRGTVVGAALSYGQANVDLDLSGTGKVKSPRIALYGSHVSGQWEFRGTAGYADQDFETRRLVTVGANNSIASGSHRGDEWSMSAEAEYTINKGGYQLKPLVGLRYISLKEDGYTETGSNAALNVAGRTTDSVVSLLGMRYVRPFNAGAGSFEARAIWSHEFGDANPAISGRLAAAPAGTASFTVAGVPIKRDALTLGAGFSNQAARNLSLYADFNVELRGSGQSQYGLMAGMRYSF